MNNETTFVLKNNHEAKPKIPARRWNVIMFQPDELPSIVGHRLNTRSAFIVLHRWDHRVKGAVLIPWPSDVPTPSEWGPIDCEVVIDELAKNNSKKTFRRSNR